MDSFRVMNENRVLWLNVTGSGNETAAHLIENYCITLMFCAFDGAPNILRLYGKGKEIKKGDITWNELIALFPETPGTRQIFDIHLESAQTSCGMSIPFFEFKSERNQLNDWAAEQGKKELSTTGKTKTKQVSMVCLHIF